MNNIIFIQPDFPKPVNEPFTGFERYETTLNIPVKIPIDELRHLLNDSVPVDFSGEENGVTGILKNDQLTYTLNRTAINFHTNNNRISFSTSISGLARIKGLLKLVLFKTTISAHADIQGELSGEIFLTIDEQWNLIPSIQLVANIDEAKIPIKGIGSSISVRSTLTRKINRQLEKITEKLIEAITKKLHIQKTANKIWNQLYLSKLINKEPPIWVRVEPRSVVFKPFDMNDSEYIYAGIGIKTFIDTFITDDHPVIADISALPNLEFQSNLSDKFSIYLPIQIEIDVINETFSSVVTNQSFEIAENARITITKISLTANSDKLVVQLDFKSDENCYFNNVEGVIYLIGNVYYDKVSNSIKITNLDYDFNTKKLLVSMANWLLKPILLSKLEKKLVFPLDSHLNSLLKKATDLIDNLKIPKEISASIKIEAITLDNVILRDNFFHLLVLCHGSISAQLFSFDES
jgi:hypothetical protein